MRRCLGGALVALVLTARAGSAQSPWDRYEKRTIASVVASEDTSVREFLDVHPSSDVVVSAADFPSRATVEFLDSMRATPPEDMRVLASWVKMLNLPADRTTLFAREVLFKEDSLLLWIPVYDSLIGDLRAEIRPDSLLTLYVTYHGATGSRAAIRWIFTVNDFTGPEPPFPPSQRELNGFLIGQSLKAIDASFASRIQVDTSQDGWVDRAYLVDRPHRAYMAFKFEPDRPKAAVSVQVAGDAGAPVDGLLRVRLGDSRDTLIARVGRPTRITHEDDVNVDLFSYDGRNYSYEVDSTGRVSSIQIMGLEGFPDSAPVVGLSLDSLVRALQGSWSQALDVLSPEIEVYPDSQTTVSFTHGARQDLEDTSSALRRVLISGPRSLVRVLEDASVRAKGESSVRVWEQGGVGLVWKFPDPIPVAEVVLKVEDARWVLWEVTYR